MQDSVYKALKRQWIQLKEMQLSASEWQPLEGFEKSCVCWKERKTDYRTHLSSDVRLDRKIYQ